MAPKRADTVEELTLMKKCYCDAKAQGLSQKKVYKEAAVLYNMKYLENSNIPYPTTRELLKQSINNPKSHTVAADTTLTPSPTVTIPASLPQGEDAEEAEKKKRARQEKKRNTAIAKKQKNKHLVEVENRPLTIGEIQETPLELLLAYSNSINENSGKTAKGKKEITLHKDLPVFKDAITSYFERKRIEKYTHQQS